MKSRKVKAAAKSKAFISKRKLKGNIPLDACSDSDADVDYDSLLYDERDERNNELSTDDDDLLQQKEDVSSEEEVLPITDDEKEEWDDEVDEKEDWDDEGSENEDERDVDENSEEDFEKGLPSRDAWGKKKAIYFNADFVDQDRGKSYREKDAEQAKAEEEEAMHMQKNFLGLFTGDDEDIPEVDKTSVDEDLQKKELEIENVMSLNKEGKFKYLKKKCPEVLVFIKEFEEKLTEIKDRLVPLLELVKNGKIISGMGTHYIKLRYQILLNYCTNLSFFMALKSNGLLTDNHPVLQRIYSFKKLINQMNSVSESANKEIDIILEKLQGNEEILFDESTTSGTSQNEKISRRKNDDKMFNESLDTIPGEEQMDVDPDLTTEKRTISYEIAKNKGLVARRKKELRNPRVRHRMKYRKAKIRRKGQVREVIREVKRYEGEPTGISTHVIRSIKMK